MSDNGYRPVPKGFATTAIHASQETEQWDSRAVVAPLVTSSVFKRDVTAKCEKYTYGRLQNPNREMLENLLAKLDNGKHGVTFSSGLGAITSLIFLVKTGGNIILNDHIYGGTQSLLSQTAESFNIDLTCVDMTDLGQLENAVKPNTKLIFAETPTNPTLKVIDLKGVAAIAKKNGIIFVVDNTFCTPYLQRPLDFGADLVLYSLTKFMNGHTDVIMGAITTSDEKLYKRLQQIQTSTGIIPTPCDCYQVIRSLKTLALRMQQHNKNSLALAKYLEGHPRVEKVLHPALQSHPQHDLYKKQTCGHGGIFSFFLRGKLNDCNKLMKSLKYFIHAHTLGGVESLVLLPAYSSHSYVSPEIRRNMGITDNLIRVSVGLEDIEDLIADFEESFKKLDD